MLNWFEWVKDEVGVGGTVYRSVIGAPSLRASFAADLPRLGGVPGPRGATG